MGQCTCKTCRCHNCNTQQNVGLGIDTGGTYTDAVLMDLDTGRVIEKNKARTTHDDLVVGIVQALDGLSSSLFDDIRLTSISTTLATNTTLEGKGYPCDR